MAGRAAVEPDDTIPNSRIFSLNEDLEWVVVKEPIHFYEEFMGLGPGLSFGKSLLACLNENITIGLVPCAVGGSTVQYWLDNETHRGVRLYSNFEERVKASQEVDVLKGVLWHQGENNAFPELYRGYQQNLEKLFGQFRVTAGDPQLPVYMVSWVIL